MRVRWAGCCCGRTPPLRRAAALLSDAPDPEISDLTSQATVKEDERLAVKAELAQLQATLDAKKAEGGAAIVYSPEENPELMAEIAELVSQVAAKEEELRILQYGTTVCQCHPLAPWALDAAATPAVPAAGTIQRGRQDATERGADKAGAG